MIESSGDRGRCGGLFLKLGGGYKYALERFHFDVLLRLDADALVIGPRPEEDALRAFATQPRVGAAWLVSRGARREASGHAARGKAPPSRGRMAWHQGPREVACAAPMASTKRRRTATRTVTTRWVAPTSTVASASVTSRYGDRSNGPLQPRANPVRTT